jgi:HEAT repeat protein
LVPNNENHMLKRLIAALISTSFIFHNCPNIQAGDFSVNELPVPGAMVEESASFAPLALKGLIVNPRRPLEFQFIVDTGKGPQDVRFIKEEAGRLVKYFLAGLTIPEGDLWVNLSPYEKDRITTSSLGRTELGRDLLAQDYILKQLTASLIYPEKDLGKEFWKRVYARAKERFGTSDVPVNAFNKVWVLPREAQVYENGSAAYVTRSTLKVMLDEDYLAARKHTQAPSTRDAAHSVGAGIVRDIVFPEIEKEVNTGKNFAPLRQIYDAMILAKWYKGTIQNGLLEALYTNKKKLAGVNLDDPGVKEQIYHRYLQAYKTGVFNYIKEDPASDGQTVPRKYFSGGITQLGTFALNKTHDAAMLGQASGALLELTVSLAALKPPVSVTKEGPYERTGLPFLQAPLEMHMNADIADMGQTAQWTLGHPLFTAGLTKTDIEADAAMVSELVRIALSHPYVSSVGIGTILGIGISGAGVLMMGTERYLNKYLANAEKITAHLFLNPFVFFFVGVTLSSLFNGADTGLTEGRQLLLPYLVQTATAVSLLLSSGGLHLAKKFHIVHAPPNITVWRLKGEVDKIIKSLNDEHADVREAAREAVDELVKDKKQRRKLGMEQVNSFNPDSREWGMTVLGELAAANPKTAQSEQYDLGYDTIMSDYPDVVSWSIALLLKSNSPDAIEPLKRLLRNEPSPRNRRAAIIGLGKRGGIKFFDLVLDVATHDLPGDDHSRSALKMLGGWEDKRAIQPLVKSLGGPNSLFDETIKVLEVLHADREDLFQGYLAGLSSRNEFAVRKSIAALGNTGDKRAIPALISSFGGQISLFDDKIKVLRKLNAGDEDLFQAYVAGLSSGSEAARRKSIAALGDTGDKRAIQALILSLAESDSLFDEKIKVLKTLHAGNEELFQGYLAGLSSQNEIIKRKAIMALGDTGDKRAIEPLRTLYNERKPGYTLNVENGLISDALRKLGAADHAQLSLPPGGIDLNHIDVRRTGKAIRVLFDPSQVKKLAEDGFEGFTPVILSLAPISSLFQLLKINTAR